MADIGEEDLMPGARFAHTKDLNNGTLDNFSVLEILPDSQYRYLTGQTFLLKKEDQKAIREEWTLIASPLPQEQIALGQERPTLVHCPECGEVFMFWRTNEYLCPGCR